MVEEDGQVAILMKAHQHSNGVLHSADHAAWWLEGTWSADFTVSTVFSSHSDVAITIHSTDPKWRIRQRSGTFERVTRIGRLLRR